MKTKPVSSGTHGSTPSAGEAPRTSARSGADHLDVYQLSRRLCVPATIDKSGWLRGEIELLFVRVPDGIHPTELKIGIDVSAANIRRLGNAFKLCERYNQALRQVQLIASAELLQQIASRQEEHMGYRRVRYFTLTNEIQFLENCLKVVAL